MDLQEQIEEGLPTLQPNAVYTINKEDTNRLLMAIVTSWLPVGTEACWRGVAVPPLPKICPPSETLEV